MTERRFFSALETLYEAALDPAKWTAFMDQFGPIINSIGGHYYIWDQHANAITFGVPSSHYTDADNSAYIEHWGEHDSMRKLSLSRGGEWLLNDRVLDHKHIAKDPFHNDYLRPLDVRYVAGYRTNSATPASSAISFSRNSRQDPLGSVEMEWLMRLQPHLELAGRLHREMIRLQLSAAMREQALFTLDYPIALAYENGAIAFINSAAEQWLSTNGVITVKFERLVGNGRQAQESLSRSLRKAYAERVSSIQAVARRDGGKPFQMMFMPLSPFSPMGSAFHRPLVLIVVTDPQAKVSLTEAHLQTLFGLTAAEARVCLALGEGKTLEEIAQGASVSINTARTQLKQSLKKTGTSRQAELINIIRAMPKLKTVTAPDGAVRPNDR